MAINVQFKSEIERLVREKKGKRVHRFEYEGKVFWIKQPEQLHGIFRFLKPHPKQAFESELKVLLELAEKNAPVPRVVYYGEDFFVMEDVGLSLSYWMDYPDYSEQQKVKMLTDASQALIVLHQKGLVHGRPAIRDIAWRDGEVAFLDFESRSKSKKRHWLVVRDMLFFFDSLCREENVSDELILQSAIYYREHCQYQDWQMMMDYLQRFKWLYFILVIFKPIAKKDLVGIYRLVELLLLKETQ